MSSAPASPEHTAALHTHDSNIDTQTAETHSKEPRFVTTQSEREVRADGTKAKQFYLIDSAGRRHLAVVGQESEAKDCHYHYHLEASFSHLHKGAWKNASAVQDWLASIFARQAKGEILGLGPERATPQETDLKASSKEGATTASNVGTMSHGPDGPPVSEGIKLDSWPPVPPPKRSQLPLADLPPFSLPEPPPPSIQKTVAEVNAEAAQARSLALAALVARAERLHTLRTTAVAAALDWLHGHLPADEVQLLQSNISGLADTLSEIDGLSQLPSVNSTSAAHASEGMSLPVPQAIGFSLEAACPVISTDGPQQHNVAQSGRVPAAPLSAAALLQQPIGQGDISASLLSTTATPTMEAASLHQLQRLPFVHPLHPLYPGTPQPAVDTSGTKTSMPSDRPDKTLDVEISRDAAAAATQQAEAARRARLVTEALDYLREITSTFMPLPVQADVGAVASIAAASKHQVEAVALLARESLWTMQRIAEVHLATLRSSDVTDDPRDALAARLPIIAAAADAVTQRDVAVASAAARAAAERAMRLTEAGQLATSSLPDIKELVKPATKPRTPHAKCIQAKCTAKAAAAAAAARTSNAPPAVPISSAAAADDAVSSAPSPWMTDPQPVTPAADLQPEIAAVTAVAEENPLTQPVDGGSQGIQAASMQRHEDGSDPESDSQLEAVWPASTDFEEPFPFVDDIICGPLGNAVTIIRQGKGRLDAARICEINSVARGMVTAALRRLQHTAPWTQDPAFRRSIEEKVTQLRRDGGRISQEKALSTNRKARACVIRGVEALLKAVEAYAA